MELLSPAGSFETALAAFAAGADAVYLGLDAFSARASAVNLSADQLRDLLAFARGRGKKVYVTFNTLVDDDRLPEAVEKLALLEELRPDALIVQDLGIARLVRQRFPALALHASTQLVAHNLEGVLALRELGFTRVVLARELSLDDVRSIARRCGVEIEVFIHGALCYSISGLCLFSALEKERSGNRGQCAYCCRLAYADGSGRRALPFSMKDLRLDDSLAALADAGVASLKIEGRMKSALYVSTVTAYYRQMLDGAPAALTRADLESVFSRRTTSLYAHGYSGGAASPVDPVSLGHLGTPIGAVKRVTKDREGRTWLRFHTSRALEKHDGLQFAAPAGGKPLGFGIAEMRLALARTPVFDVPADSDVEILLPPEFLCPKDGAAAPALDRATVYCSASNALRRRFPVPSFRPADVDAGIAVDVAVTLAANGLAVAATPHLPGEAETLQLADAAPLAPAHDAARSPDAVRRAFAKLGGTAWRLGAFTLVDPDGLFAPSSRLNDLRRALVEKLDALRLARRRARIDAALGVRNAEGLALGAGCPARKTHEEKSLKLRLDQTLPDDAAAYSEIVFALGRVPGPEAAARLAECAEQTHRPAAEFRLALPVFTLEKDFNALRIAVRHLVRLGFRKWEAADLATLRLLRQVDAALDVTADWSLYGFNRAALATFADFGLARFVTSPESTPANLAYYAALPAGPIFLAQQSTPLFISLTRPATDDPAHLTGLHGDAFTSFTRDGLWITTRPTPRRFDFPDGASTRVDLSWDPPAAS